MKCNYVFLLFNRSFYSKITSFFFLIAPFACYVLVLSIYKLQYIGEALIRVDGCFNIEQLFYF